jgi:hypothetical protein
MALLQLCFLQTQDIQIVLAAEIGERVGVIAHQGT